jgi:Tfp pilus assembly protein PilF
MTLRHALLTAVFLGCSLLGASAAEMPLWEGVTKTPDMLAADKAFIEAAGKQANGDLTAASQASIDKGWDAFGKGDLDAAIRHLNQAWLLDPNNGNIYWAFAVLTHSRGDGTSVSDQWFAEAERLMPDNGRVLTDHGRALDEAGEPQRARTYFEKALAMNPNDVVAHLGMARVLTALGDKAGAEKHKAEQIRLSVERPLWEELTKTPKMLAADKEFVAAVAKNQNGDLKAGAKFSVAQGWDAFDKGDLNVAIRRFNQAWLLDPENGDIYYGFALVTHLRGEGLAETERWLAKAEQLMPGNVDLLSDYGQVLEDNGDPARARAYWEKALAIDPNDADSHGGMVRVLTALGDAAGAQKHQAEVDRLGKK